MEGRSSVGLQLTDSLNQRTVSLMALFFFLASLCFDLGVGVGGVGLFAFKSQSMPCFLAFDFQLQDIQLGLSVLELKFSLVESLLQLPDLPLLDFK